MSHLRSVTLARRGGDQFPFSVPAIRSPDPPRLLPARRRLFWLHQTARADAPGAKIYSFDGGPVRQVEYDSLEHVALTRDFLNDHSSFLRHLASQGQTTANDNTSSESLE